MADDAVQRQIDQAVRRQRNYSQGAEGERLVAQTLGFVERYGWTALHDVHWPGRPQANIDHIAIGPGGVVVIDAKNWTGDVAVTNGVLRQNGYSRARETSAAADATAAVAARLAPQHRMAARGVLCLVAHDVETTRIEATDVVGRAGLTEYLVHLPQRLSAYDVADIARHLHRELAGAKSPDAITSAYLDRPAPVSRQGRSRAPREAMPPAARQQPRGRQTSRPHSAPTWSAGRFVVTAVRKLMSLALRLLFVAMLVGIGVVALQAASEAYLDRISTQSP